MKETVRPKKARSKRCKANREKRTRKLERTPKGRQNNGTRKRTRKRISEKANIKRRATREGNAKTLQKKD